MSDSLAIVVSQYNQFVTSNLLKGCMDALKDCDYTILDPIFVPGAYEIPYGIKKSFSLKPKGVVALGCVVRGETPHFDFICQSVSHFVMDLSLQFDIPVSFGLLTTINVDQAIERSGGKKGNKGAEAAHALLDLILL